MRKILEENVFPVFFIYRYMQFLKRKRKLNDAIDKYNLKHFSDFNIEDHKSSDNLFILGSGASINDYGKEEWEKIKNGDSFGFNFWMIHDFVPTYYMFEPMKKPNREKKFIQLLNLKKGQYKNTPFILKDLETREFPFDKVPERLKNNFYVPYKFKISGNSKKSLNKSIIYIKKLNLLNESIQLFRKGSLSQAIYFGYQFNYKNIVLCGVDLNSTDYFYESQHFKMKDLPIPKTGQTGKVHKTFDKQKYNITIDDVIKCMQDTLLSDRNLYIGSKKSALHPELDYYFNED